MVKPIATNMVDINLKQTTKNIGKNKINNKINKI